MAFRTLLAKYAGTCRRCSETFDAGTRIRSYDGVDLAGPEVDDVQAWTEHGFRWADDGPNAYNAGEEYR